jgi:hypothetical protein
MVHVKPSGGFKLTSKEDELVAPHPIYCLIKILYFRKCTGAYDDDENSAADM